MTNNYLKIPFASLARRITGTAIFTFHVTALVDNFTIVTRIASVTFAGFSVRVTLTIITAFCFSYTARVENFAIDATIARLARTRTV